MSDATERPEDTVRRYAQMIQEFEAWQQQYREAAELWDALGLKPNQQVTEAVLIGKLANFDAGGTTLSIANTDSCDWVTQLGILEGALVIIKSSPFQEG